MFDCLYLKVCPPHFLGSRWQCVFQVRVHSFPVSSCKLFVASQHHALKWCWCRVYGFVEYCDSWFMNCFDVYFLFLHVSMSWFMKGSRNWKLIFPGNCNWSCLGNVVVHIVGDHHYHDCLCLWGVWLQTFACEHWRMPHQLIWTYIWECWVSVSHVVRDLALFSGFCLCCFSSFPPIMTSSTEVEHGCT